MPRGVEHRRDDQGSALWTIWRGRQEDPGTYSTQVVTRGIDAVTNIVAEH